MNRTILHAVLGTAFVASALLGAGTPAHAVHDDDPRGTIVSSDFGTQSMNSSNPHDGGTGGGAACLVTKREKCR